jgi:heme A synthase
VPDRLRAATGAAGLAVLIQTGLGIATLLLKVPIPLAVLHQTMGLVVLAVVLVAAHTALPPLAFVPRERN